ncbi:hypothetical protein UA08_07098 [Talaromyces atroroseus]|uniref:Rhamnogalacturonase A n=1 Tax=Talaromyces atroroseus TaxID=1441469 RepID=A0A225ARF4_TALAT|nr:hypothetical protein UA08_07098 [Talaromyces atroroseus]OKL57526.1 hypothetical protein UA08_07098 [Talaromyces atroroseus]
MRFCPSAPLKETLFLAIPLWANIISAAANIDFDALGATTSLAEKSTICNILDYGAVADGVTDIAEAISTAFTSCVAGNAATLYIPEGNYSLATGVKLNGASGWAFQIDGLITLTSDGDFDGNAFIIERGSDFELFSSNNLGAIDGQGYIARRDSTGQNARLVRLIDMDSVSIHNMILIDSPTFHFVLDDVSNLELFYVTIRAGDIGATDGIDLICTNNCYLHDFEVTNRDECVSVKAGSDNVLIEEAYCNHSGGMSIGSLVAGNVVSNITMRNIYSYECVQMLMIKTFPGGTGAQGNVTDSVFENFWGYSTTYALDINQYWQETYSPDTGAVALNNLVFTNWTGSLADGMERGPVMWSASDIVPSQNITLEGFYMGGLTGDRMINKCNNVYGSGGCIQAATGTTTYSTVVTTWSVAPSGWTAPASPTWGVSGYGLTVPIPVYTPSVFWPTASASATAAVVTSSPTALYVVSSSAIPVSSVVSSSHAVSTDASTPSSATLATITSLPPATTSTSSTSTSSTSDSSLFMSIDEPSVSPQPTDVAEDYGGCEANYPSPAFQPENKHRHGHGQHFHRRRLH